MTQERKKIVIWTQDPSGKIIGCADKHQQMIWDRAYHQGQVDRDAELKAELVGNNHNLKAAKQMRDRALKELNEEYERNTKLEDGILLLQKVANEDRAEINQLKAQLSAKGEPVGYVRKYALEHLANTKAHTIIDALSIYDGDIPLYATQQAAPDPEQAHKQIDFLEAESARLRKAIEWALGANGDFRERGENEGAYWWREELQARSGMIWNGER